MKKIIYGLFLSFCLIESAGSCIRDYSDEENDNSYIGLCEDSLAKFREEMNLDSMSYVERMENELRSEFLEEELRFKEWESRIPPEIKAERARQNARSKNILLSYIDAELERIRISKIKVEPPELQNYIWREDLAGIRFCTTKYPPELQNLREDLAGIKFCTTKYPHNAE